MILTVTAHSALDRIIFIDEFQPGTVMRAERTVQTAGGKGLDAALVLRTLGAEALGISLIAGDAGRQLTEVLDHLGVRHDMVEVGGETRIAHVLVETQRHRHSHIITGKLEISGEHYREFLRRYQGHLAHTRWVLAAGSLPPDLPVNFYRTIGEMAHAAGVPLLVDSRGIPVRETLAVPPTVLKMNRAELTETFGLVADTVHDLQVRAMELVRDFHLASLVITCGEEGTIAALPHVSYLAAGPKLQAVNAAGAGDAVSAALVWRFSQGDDWVGALRWGAATGAAVAMTEGTAECYMCDIEYLLPQVRVEVVGEESFESAGGWES